MKEIESIKESDGYLNRYQHYSEVCGCEMTFSVYLPPQARERPVPALYWLSGLTCTDDNARTKGGFQRFAAKHGIAVVFDAFSVHGDVFRVAGDQLSGATRIDGGGGLHVHDEDRDGKLNVGENNHNCLKSVKF